MPGKDGDVLAEAVKILANRLAFPCFFAIRLPGVKRKLQQGKKLEMEANVAVFFTSTVAPTPTFNEATNFVAAGSAGIRNPPGDFAKTHFIKQSPQDNDASSGHWPRLTPDEIAAAVIILSMLAATLFASLLLFVRWPPGSAHPSSRIRFPFFIFTAHGITARPTTMLS